MYEGEACKFRQFGPKLVVITTSLERSKKECQSFICTHMSINPENLVNVGPVHLEIIGLPGTLKERKKNSGRI